MIFGTNSPPFVTFPNTVCFPSSQGVATSVMKNCDPFVPGPAFYPDPAGDSELRLCFTSVLPSTIDESVKRLARCVGEVRMSA